MGFLRSIYKGALVILTAPNWPNQPWSPDLTELLVAPPCPIPSGRIFCYLKWAVWCGNRTWSCGVFMYSCFGDIRGAERLWCILMCSTRFRRRGHPLRRRLYALKWGVFVKWCRMLISTWLLAPCQMFCDTDWIVDLYHQHWKCIVAAIASFRCISFRSKRLIKWCTIIMLCVTAFSIRFWRNCHVHRIYTASQLVSTWMRFAYFATIGQSFGLAWSNRTSGRLKGKEFP